MSACRPSVSSSCIRQHTSAYVSIRQNMSAEASDERLQTLCVLFLHTSAYVSIRQQRREMSACRPCVLFLPRHQPRQ
jgi:hypothetical protein